MNTGTILLNIDLATGTSALVALGMLVVPNIDRIRAFRLALTRRSAPHVGELRRAAGGLSRS
jgi:hypothetical protein